MDKTTQFAALDRILKQVKALEKRIEDLRKE